jgi:ABC-2 type transport system ATP-binding protein
MIEVENLTKYYGPHPAIQDVTFEAKDGEIIGFLGPNGSGKTTTMRIITGYIPASAGTARVAGYDVFKQSLEARRRVGYLPESVPLYTDMTVREYLEFAAQLRGIKGQERDENVDEAMELTNLGEVAHRVIGQLSRGFKQRVGIAQALVHDPDVLVLDEPTVGLDPRQIIEVRQLIKSLGGERTVILSTHILPEVSMLCQRVVIISNGRLVAEDTPENLTNRLRGAERVQIQVRGPADEVAGHLRKVAGVLAVEAQDGRILVECAQNRDVREELARAVVQGGYGLLELRSMGMSLEEIFLKLTTTEPAAEAVAEMAGAIEEGEAE